MTLKNQPALTRVFGCAVGAVIGDSLGMPLEFGPKQPADQLIREMISGRLPAGTFTDDTEMALALAESLLHQAPLDPNDLVQRFEIWAQSNPPDIGIQTKLVLDQVRQGKTWQEAKQWITKTRPDAAGNGSAMRCWPVALTFWHDWGLCREQSILQSETTHPHQDCLDACVFINHLICSGLNENSLPEALSEAFNTVSFSPQFFTRLQKAPDLSREHLENSGWIQHTLESVVWGLTTTENFEDAVINVVNLGNDADSAGTIIGAIAGAFYGIEQIPAAWKSRITGFYPPNHPSAWTVEKIKQLAIDLTQQI